eukprot:288736-Rhodomonas_salina.4
MERERERERERSVERKQHYGKQAGEKCERERATVRHTETHLHTALQRQRERESERCTQTHTHALALALAPCLCVVPAPFCSPGWALGWRCCQRSPPGRSLVRQAHAMPVREEERGGARCGPDDDSD